MLFIPQTELGVLTSFPRSKSGWNPRIVDSHKNQSFFNKNHEKVRTSPAILISKICVPPLFVIRLQRYWHRFFIHFHFYTYFQWNINIFFECILFIFEKTYKKLWNLHENDGMFIFHINYNTFGVGEGQKTHTSNEILT